jgi:formylglycine-generating enzyme required for sulfatase activity
VPVELGRGGIALAALLLLGPRAVGPAVWVEPHTGMRLVRLEPGSFLMGSPAGEPMRETQERQHRVQLSRPFWLGQYEVTQAEWRAVLGSRPSAL